MNRPEAHGLGSLENQTHTAPQSVISSLSTTHRLLASLSLQHKPQTTVLLTRFHSLGHKLRRIALHTTRVQRNTIETFLLVAFSHVLRESV
jgi:hypothetical protein